MYFRGKVTNDKSPYNVNMLIAGLDPLKNEPQVFWMDYISSMVSVPFAAHGYSGYFCLAVFDRYWKPDMTLEEAKSVLQKCFHELKTRMVVNQSGYTIKQIDKRGITILDDKTLEPIRGTGVVEADVAMQD
jgi:20S proteasome subunit beta 4